MQRCLDSISSQSFTDYVHIVVDPGSDDGSRDLILNSTSSQLLPVFQRDSCAPEGLNHGIAKATGEYVLFINSDDCLVEGALELTYNKLEETCFPDILFMGGYIEDSTNSSRRRFFPGSTHGVIHALGLSQFFQQGAVVKTDIVRQANGFNPTNRTCWDAELFLQLLAKTDLRRSRCCDPIAIFVIHPESITGSKRVQGQYLLDSERIVRTYYGNLIHNVRGFISICPWGLRILLKYLLDPILALWRLSSFFAA